MMTREKHCQILAHYLRHLKISDLENLLTSMKREQHAWMNLGMSNQIAIQNETDKAVDQAIHYIPDTYLERIESTIFGEGGENNG